jgi:hypothetical protein
MTLLTRNRKGGRIQEGSQAKDNDIGTMAQKLEYTRRGAMTPIRN